MVKIIHFVHLFQVFQIITQLYPFVSWFEISAVIDTNHTEYCFESYRFS